jgi:hemerythrin-like domain-containing protein
MFDNQEYQPFLAHLRDEHEALRARVTAIRGELPADDATDMSHDTMQALLTQLLQLRACMEKHFAEEMDGGCIEEAVCRRPALAHRATDIEHEHPALLEQLEEIIQMLEPGESIPPICQVRERLDAFIERLQQHEAKEDRLLLEGFDVVKGDERYV